MSALPLLFSPVRIRGVAIRNRIVSTGHHTHLADGKPNDRLIAYHRARAAGGTGLIIVEVAGVHPSAYFSPDVMNAYDPACIDGYRRLADAVHEEGGRIFAQLFHPGREIKMSSDGTTPIAHAPSSVPNERFHLMPRAMPKRLIREVVAGFGRSARHMQQAGIDGVEIVASHGYLPAQFLNPAVNVRDDRYGGRFENRLRFVREAIQAIRTETDNFIVGLRFSASEMEPAGIDEDGAAEICAALDADGELDYFNLVTGTSATLGGAVHIVAPMMVEIGYVAPFAATVKARVTRPVIVTGRINQPQTAESILAAGQADLCGMTRALICDPDMPNKAAGERFDDIRACIGCNQACIGHSHNMAPISCIQRPESGRELEYGVRVKSARPKRVLVAGGGPAGMKAAAVAAERGHLVTLYERSRQLGGQVLLAQLLPGRSEFGGLATNLSREMSNAGVTALTGAALTRDIVDREQPDAVIIATGATPRHPEVPGEQEAHVVTAWDVLANKANVGQSVVVVDWRCDWVGMGVAERLAREGCRVRLSVNGYMPGQTLQQYVRDQWLGTLHKLGVEIIPMTRLYGVDSDTVYLQHTTSDEAIVCDEVQTLVLSLGSASDFELENELDGVACEVFSVGDCVCPRTAEEAVLEGLKVGVSL